MRFDNIPQLPREGLDLNLESLFFFVGVDDVIGRSSNWIIRFASSWTNYDEVDDDIVRIASTPDVEAKF